MTVSGIIMEHVASALRANPELSGVRIVTQNEQDLATLIQTEEGKLDGIVAVVTVDTVSKVHSMPPKYDVSFSVMVTEVVPVNRERSAFRTAIDVAETCGETVDAAEIGHFDLLRHTVPADGILNAVAECRCECTPRYEQEN